MELRPGNREKGWNDPPEFLHNTPESATATPSKKTLLNQRVAHNLDGKVSITQEDISNSNQSKLNEPPKITVPQNSTIVKPENQTQSSSFEIVPLEQIESVLNDKVQILKDNQCKNCEEIIKRFKILSSYWQKLNPKVQERMSNLVKALENNELNTANEIHVGLMLDFPSDVIQWMVGIKRLIHELIQINQS